MPPKKAAEPTAPRGSGVVAVAPSAPGVKTFRVNPNNEKPAPGSKMDPATYGLLPVRCYTCGNPIGHHQDDLEKWIEEGGDLAGFYDYYGVPHKQHPQLNAWLDDETPSVTQETKAMERLLTKDMPAYFERYKEKYAGAKDWASRGTHLEPLPYTLEQRVLMWIHGDPEAQKVIVEFINVLEEKGILGKIYDVQEVPAKNRAVVTRRLKYGLGARGFQIAHGIQGFRYCCKTNLRPPPKIF